MSRWNASKPVSTRSRVHHVRRASDRVLAAWSMSAGECGGAPVSEPRSCCARPRRTRTRWSGRTQAGLRQRRHSRRPAGTGPTCSSQATRATVTCRTRPCSRTSSMPAPFGLCTPVHNQHVSVRWTYRQKRSASGIRRRGPRAAQERLHVRRGGPRRVAGGVNTVPQVWQVFSNSGTARLATQHGLQEVEVRTLSADRRGRCKPTGAALLLR